MHDIRLIRDDPAAFDAALARRGLPPAASEILEIDRARREKITAAETARAEAKESARRIAADVAARKKRGEDISDVRETVQKAFGIVDKKTVAALEEDAKAADARLTDLLSGLPNTPLDSVPDGTDEADNVELRRWGTPRDFPFAPKEHYEIAEAMGCMDFETAAKLSGARFVVMRGALTRLHRAIAQFMLDTHVDRNGYTETWTPVLVRDEVLYGTGQLPKFADDQYRTTDGFWLIPTAEVSLTNTVAGEILAEADLPRRLTAWTQCFRKEAGSAGKDTRGMLRQHQFEKVELVSITRPEDSLAELDRMTACAEGILEALELPYRTIVLCTGDMGFGARRTHDIEVWLPGQDAYREISSCSVCGDFQARRMNARFRREGEKRPDFVHTLNGSGVAVGRCLIAVIENGQEEDGSVTLPEALRPYLRNAGRIAPDGALD